MAFGPNGWLSVHPICTQIDEDENFIYAPELTIKDMILTFQSMLNSHLHNPKTLVLSCLCIRCNNVSL